MTDDNTILLTGRKERFAQELAKGTAAAEAARIAGYKPGPGLYVTVHRLTRDPKVLLRVAQLRAPVVEEVGLTLKGHLSELEALRNTAKQEKQLSAAIRAEVARGQVGGFYAGVNRFEDLEALPDDELEQLAKGKRPRSLRLVKGA